MDSLSSASPAPAESPVQAGTHQQRTATFRSACRAILRQPRRAAIVLGALATLAVAGWLIGRQVWAAYHWQLVQAEVQKHRYARAKQSIVVCHGVWPEDRAVLILAARIARALNHFDEADKFLMRYRELHGEDDDLLLERVLLRCERGEVDAVTVLCENLVANGHERTPLILEALIAGHVRAYRLPEAKLYVSLWQERDPDNAQMENLKGQTLELGMQQHDALVAYRRAIQLNPDHDESRYRLARLLVDLSQSQEALPHLDLLYQRQPTDVEVLVELGRCLARLNQPEQAAQFLAKARAVKPDHAPALAESGRIAIHQGELAQAETWLREASRLAPGEFEILYQLTQCLARLGKTQEARDLEPRLRQLEVDGKRMQQIYGQLMSRNPKDPNLHLELGMIHMRAGAPLEGVRWLNEALKIDPRHEPTHEAFARYYHAIGQIGRAAKHREFVKSKDASTQVEKIGGPFP